MLVEGKSCPVKNKKNKCKVNKTKNIVTSIVPREEDIVDSTVPFEKECVSSTVLQENDFVSSTVPLENDFVSSTVTTEKENGEAPDETNLENSEESNNTIVETEFISLQGNQVGIDPHTNQLSINRGQDTNITAQDGKTDGEKQDIATTLSISQDEIVLEEFEAEFTSSLSGVSGHAYSLPQPFVQQESCLTSTIVETNEHSEDGDEKDCVVQNSSDTVTIMNCPLCPSTFETAFGLSRHVQSKHKDVNVKIERQKCKLCNVESMNLNQHMKRMHPDSLPSTKCPIITCGLVFESKQHYYQHRKNCVTCPYCDHKESKPGRLNKHINAHIKKNHTKKDALLTSSSSIVATEQAEFSLPSDSSLNAEREKRNSILEEKRSSYLPPPPTAVCFDDVEHDNTILDHPEHDNTILAHLEPENTIPALKSSVVPLFEAFDENNPRINLLNSNNNMNSVLMKMNSAQSSRLFPMINLSFTPDKSTAGSSSPIINININQESPMNIPLLHSSPNIDQSNRVFISKHQNSKENSADKDMTFNYSTPFKNVDCDRDSNVFSANIDTKTIYQETDTNVQCDEDLQKALAKELMKGRSKYPFDTNDEEEYYSEIEQNDDPHYTLQRRSKKDKTQQVLRKVDLEVEERIAKNKALQEKFYRFLLGKKCI